MATSSFSKRTNKTPDAPPEQPEPTPQPQTPDSAVVPATSREVAEPRPQSDDMSGDWGRDDVRLPRVNLVHKTSASELIEKFGIGGFILNKEVKLADGKAPLTVYAIRSGKDYQQKLPYGDPTTPTVYKTEQEVLNNGGSFNYKDVDSGSYFQPRAHIQLVIPAPKGLDEAALALFPYEFNGTDYAMALFTVSSSAFTSVGKDLATLRANNKVMRKGLRFGNLQLTSEIRKNAKNSWHIPVVKFTGENPPELVAFLEGLL